jgi:hypothetical protein
MNTQNLILLTTMDFSFFTFVVCLECVMLIVCPSYNNYLKCHDLHLWHYYLDILTPMNIQMAVTIYTLKSRYILYSLINTYVITFQKCNCIHFCMDQGSSVGEATHYGLGDLGIESWWDQMFHTHSDRPWGLPSLLFNWYRVLPGGKAVGVWRWPSTPI